MNVGFLIMEYGNLKKCNICSAEKIIEFYYIDNRAKDGRNSTCKKCLKQKRKGLSSEYSRRIVKTKEGLLKRIYYTQKSKSKKRGHKAPEYNINDFLSYWITNDDFNLLFKNWEISNYDNNLKPSCDRKDNNLGYTWENIQFTTLYYNLRKQQLCDQQKEICKKIGIQRTKVIIQKNLKKETVRVWNGGTIEIKKEYKSINNIRSVCRGDRKIAYGFIWEYLK